MRAVIRSAIVVSLGLAAAASAAEAPAARLAFEPNQGQLPAGVDFRVHAGGHSVSLTSAGTVIGTPDATVRLLLRGGRTDVTPTGGERLEQTVHSFRGSDRTRWRTGVPTFGRVVYAGVYPGVDLVYHSCGTRLEYDFVVGAGRDGGVIELEVQGGSGVGIDAAGRLVVETGSGPVRQRAPQLYQQRGAVRTDVDGAWELRGDRRVGFRIGEHDRRLPLVIDPVLESSTYFGGDGTDANAYLAVDAAGATYLAGISDSTSLPGTSQGTAGGSDAVVTKILPDGSIAWTAFIGGSAEDLVRGVAVNTRGELLLAGVTNSDDLPLVSAMQAERAGGYDGFAARLAADGRSLLFSTYVGGTGSDNVWGLAREPDDTFWIAGQTTSADLPGTDALPGSPPHGGGQDGFVLRLAADGSAVLHGLFLGDAGNDSITAIALDSTGRPWVAGTTNSPAFAEAQQTLLQSGHGGGDDLFLLQLERASTGVRFGSYLGGSSGDTFPTLAVGPGDIVAVAGTTTSDDVELVDASAWQPAYAGGSDTLLVVVDGPSRALLSATYHGGSGFDGTIGMAFDAAGALHLVGLAASADFPLVDPLQDTVAGPYDATVSTFDPTGSRLTFSTYFGGGGGDTLRSVLAPPTGGLIVAGSTSSSDLPAVGASSAQQTYQGGALDLFVARFDTPVAPRSQPPALLSVEVDASSPEIIKGTTRRLSAVGVYSDGTRRELTANVAWNSQLRTVARVSRRGVVRAVNTGVVLITAAHQGVTSEPVALAVTNEPALVALRIEPEDPTLRQHEKLPLRAIGTLPDESEQDVTALARWGTTSRATAYVDVAGVAEGRAIGRCGVMATVGGLVADETLTVTPPLALTALEVEPTVLDLVVNGSAELSVVGVFEDESRRALSSGLVFSNTRPTVATTDPTGQVTARNPGISVLRVVRDGVTSPPVTVTVGSAPALERIEIAPRDPSVGVGRALQLSLTGYRSDGSQVELADRAGWFVTNRRPARVERGGVVRGLQVGSTVLNARVQQLRDSVTLTVDPPPPLTSLRVQPGLVILAATARNYPLHVLGTYEDGVEEDVTSRATLRIFDSRVAALSRGHVLNARSEGATIVTARLAGIVSPPARVVVRAPVVLEEIVVSPPLMSAVVGSRPAYTAQGIYSDGSRRNLTARVRWLSSDLSVASIGSRGVARTKLAGTALIRAQATGVTSNVATLNVIGGPQLESIELSTGSGTVEVGATVYFQIVGVYDDGGRRSLNGRVGLTVADRAVASPLGGTPSVLARRAGETTVTVTHLGVTSNAVPLTVEPRPTLLSIEIEPPSAEVARGEAVAFQAFGDFDDGSHRRLPVVTWRVAHRTVAAIGGSGTATGRRRGQTTVTATLLGVSGQADLSVTDPQVVAMSLTPADATVRVGDVVQYQLLRTFEDGTTRSGFSLDVIVGSSNGRIARRAGAGRFRIVRPGAVTITAVDRGSGVRAMAQLNALARPTTTAVLLSPAGRVDTHIGARTQFTVTQVLSTGVRRRLTSGVRYRLTRPGIMRVNRRGLGRTVGVGTVDLVAQVAGINSNSVRIVVAEPPVVALRIRTSYVGASILPVGARATLYVTALLADGRARSVTSGVTWTSSAPGTVSVSATGALRALAEGEADITAEYEGQSEVLHVGVAPAELQAVRVTPESAWLQEDALTNLGARSSWSDRSLNADVTTEVTWASSDPSVADVSTSGVVIPRGTGTVTITATLDGVTSNAAEITITPAPE